MYTLLCRDLGMGECVYIAKGHTENEVIHSMKDYLTTNHPDRIEVMRNMMSEDQIDETLREKIRREP